MAKVGLFLISGKIKKYFYAPKQATFLKKSILFIINPISGGKSKLSFPALAQRYLDDRLFIPAFIFTTGTGHASSIVTENPGTDIIVAVGGDGTINEVASALKGSRQCMGIIPCGSGNGLARSLGLPLRMSEAIARLNNLHEIRIDSGFINNRSFFNMAGVGFDAHISRRFANLKNRGLNGYIQTTFREIFSYQAQNYSLIIDGVQYDRNAFMISIANSSQYGNNVHISPFASLEDGLLDICIIKPFPLRLFPALGYRMFSRTIHRSRYVEIIKAKTVIIQRENGGEIHVDGEPLYMDKELIIKINPLSLCILT